MCGWDCTRPYIAVVFDGSAFCSGGGCAFRGGGGTSVGVMDVLLHVKAVLVVLNGMLFTVNAVAVAVVNVNVLVVERAKKGWWCMSTCQQRNPT